MQSSKLNNIGSSNIQIPSDAKRVVISQPSDQTILITWSEQSEPIEIPLSALAHFNFESARLDQRRALVLMGSPNADDIFVDASVQKVGIKIFAGTGDDRIVSESRDAFVEVFGNGGVDRANLIAGRGIFITDTEDIFCTKTTMMLPPTQAAKAYIDGLIARKLLVIHATSELIENSARELFDQLASTERGMTLLNSIEKELIASWNGRPLEASFDASDDPNAWVDNQEGTAPPVIQMSLGTLNFFSSMQVLGVTEDVIASLYFLTPVVLGHELHHVDDFLTNAPEESSDEEAVTLLENEIRQAFRARVIGEQAEMLDDRPEYSWPPLRSWTLIPRPG